MKSDGLTNPAPAVRNAEAFALKAALSRRAVNTLFGIQPLTQQVAFADNPAPDVKLRRRMGFNYQQAPSMGDRRARSGARRGWRA